GSTAGNTAIGGLSTQESETGWQVNLTNSTFHVNGAYAAFKNPLNVPLRIVNLTTNIDLSVLLFYNIFVFSMRYKYCGFFFGFLVDPDPVVKSNETCLLDCLVGKEKPRVEKKIFLLVSYGTFFVVNKIKSKKGCLQVPLWTDQSICAYAKWSWDVSKEFLNDLD
ncbi:hypothetical protein RFI_08029, partial [Reticulomyxa filosa]